MLILIAKFIFFTNAEKDSKGKCAAYTSDGLFAEYQKKGNTITFQDSCRDPRVYWFCSLDFFIWMINIYFKKLYFSIQSKVQGENSWKRFRWRYGTTAKEEACRIYTFRMDRCHTRICRYKQVSSRDLDIWVW